METSEDAPPGIPPAGIAPLWLRIVRFPLVALVLGLAALAVPLFGLIIAIERLGADVVPKAAMEPLTGAVAAVVSVIVAKLVIARLADPPADDLPFDARAHDGWRGVALSAVLMSAIVGGVALLGGYRIAGWGGGTSWPMLLFVAGLQAAFMEEVLFRGILFRFLEAFGGSWFALALSSGLFGIGHYSNPGATLFSSLAIAVEAGVLLGGAYMLTRNLWLPVGLHFGWNLAQGLLWDVPVSGFAVDGVVDAQPAGNPLISGGAFGVEASVVALLLATAVGGWLVLRAARAGHLVRPWWVRRRLARGG